MSEIKGYCKDCFFKRQQWVLTDEKMMLDRWCDVFDVFVPEDKPIDRAVKTAAEDTRRMLDSHKLTEAEMVAAKEARERVMAQLRPAVRRVA
jgi:hypothetical protein